MNTTTSDTIRPAFHAAIPGGAHTYAKGDDQFPETIAPYIVRGKGCHIWDVDGNEFIEYGMGLRAVTLGHAFESVVDAAHRQMRLGANFGRPALIELECARALQSMIPGAEMVKFGKNGSDANNAAVRLARAFTGRDMIAICADHPFYSVDDWFIGTTPMNAGIPAAVHNLVAKFRYNDLESVEAVFAAHPGRIACLMLEPEKETEPRDGFLQKALETCHRHGAVFIFDEMITGFRWHNGGAQAFHGVTADLATFGKALGNGFSIAALTGRRDIMRLGGLDHDRERVFVLSLTHAAETHSLAAALAVMHTYRDEPVVATLWRQGERLRSGLRTVIDRRGLSEFFTITGRPCALVFGTRDASKAPSQPFRTLFLQEMLRRGLLAPSFIVSYSHTDADIDRTIEVVDAALEIYARALNDGVDRHLVGRPVKPVWRTFN